MRACIFDCDGVLADSERLNFECWILALKKGFGLDCSHIDEASFMKLTAKGILEMAMQGNDKSGVSGEESIATLVAMKQHFFYQHAPKRLKAVPGVNAFLKRIRNKAMHTVLFSSARRERLNRTLHYIGVHHRFDLVLSGECMDGHSSQNRISKDYHMVEERLKLPLSQCILYEDNDDVIAHAKAQGMGMTIGIVRDFNRHIFNSAVPHYIFHDFTNIDLEKLLYGKSQIA